MVSWWFKFKRNDFVDCSGGKRIGKPQEFGGITCDPWGGHREKYRNNNLLRVLPSRTFHDIEYIWTCIFTFYLGFYLYSNTLSDIYSNILSGILSETLSGIPSGILFDIYSGILSDSLFGRDFGILPGGWGPAVPTELVSWQLRFGKEGGGEDTSDKI